MEKKQTWRIVAINTESVIVNTCSDLDVIKSKSLELMKSGEDSKYRIQYFENDMIIETVELTVYFNY